PRRHRAAPRQDGRRQQQERSTHHPTHATRLAPTDTASARSHVPGRSSRTATAEAEPADRSGAGRKKPPAGSRPRAVRCPSPSNGELRRRRLPTAKRKGRHRTDLAAPDERGDDRALHRLDPIVDHDPGRIAVPILHDLRFYRDIHKDIRLLRQRLDFGPLQRARRVPTGPSAPSAIVARAYMTPHPMPPRKVYTPAVTRPCHSDTCGATGGRSGGRDGGR